MYIISKAGKDELYISQKGDNYTIENNVILMEKFWIPITNL